jgi:hypothetical protein
MFYERKARLVVRTRNVACRNKVHVDKNIEWTTRGNDEEQKVPRGHTGIFRPNLESSMG